MNRVAQVLLVAITIFAVAGTADGSPRRKGAARGSGGTRAAGASSPVVLGIRHYTDEARTRIVIELSSRSTYKVSDITGPDRIVVNILRAGFKMDRTPIAIGSRAVKQVRLNQIRGGAQVVIDLARRTAYKQQFMAATKQPPRPARIVIDVTEPASPKLIAGAGPGRRDSLPSLPPPVTELPLRETNAAPLETATVSPKARSVVPGSGTPPRAPPSAAPERVVVLIDAGHGGDDPGARGPRGMREKEITLRIARELHERLRKEPGIDARLTRTGDHTISLERRQEMAEEADADLFVSIHVNASQNRKAQGAEIFYLSMDGMHRQAQAKERRLDDDADLDRILLALAHEEGMMLSARLAASVARGINGGAPVRVRKVMQAGFQVLKQDGIPSILVEVGFLTNTKEAKVIAGPQFADRMASAIATAVRDFSRNGLLARPSSARRELARNSG